MSLDIITSRESFNTTHNHNDLARELGVYECLWHGAGVRTIGDLRKPVANALRRIDKERRELQRFNPANGWGSVDAFEVFLTRVLAHATLHPRLKVTHSR